MFTHKADKKYGEGEIEGMFLYYLGLYYIIPYEKMHKMFNNTLYFDDCEINPETLKQKIGDEWYSMEEVEYLVADKCLANQHLDTQIEFNKMYKQEIEALKKDRDYWKSSFNKHAGRWE